MKKILLLSGFVVTSAFAGDVMTVSQFEKVAVKYLQGPHITVGFDLDDTLLDNAPSWAETRKKAKYGTLEFWDIINNSTCRKDSPKTKVQELAEWHESQGHTILVITARGGTYPNKMAECLKNTGYNPNWKVFFTPNGKTLTLKAQKVQIYYGDSDSDITDAKKAGALPVRILRSFRSTNPNKVHIGNEIVIKDSNTFK